jgi:hypothetical protein
MLMSSTFEYDLLIIEGIFGYPDSFLSMYFKGAFPFTILTTMLFDGASTMTSTTTPNIINGPANKSSPRTLLTLRILMLMIPHTIRTNNSLFIQNILTMNIITFVIPYCDYYFVMFRRDWMAMVFSYFMENG